MPVIPLSQGWYQDEALNLANSECLNLIPAYVQTQGALNADVLRSPAGLLEFSADSGEGSCRGAIRFRDELYTVQGDRFYKVDSLGVKTAIGDTVIGSGRVEMVENGAVITVVVPDEVTGYFYDPDSTFYAITDQVFIDYGPKLDVTYKDGFFFYLTATEMFQSSLVEADKGVNFDALEFTTVDANTDNNIAIDTIKNEVYVFGQNTIQVYQNVGVQGFVLASIPGAVVDRGLTTRFAQIEFQNSYLFMGAGKNEGISIWQGLSGASERISTPAIDNLLQSLPIEDLGNSYAFKYAESGNYFCGFTVPNQVTLIYDLSSSRMAQRPIWHRRASSATAEGVYRVSHIEQVYGKILAMDSIDGRIGEVNIDTFTEYGSEVLRRFNTIYFNKTGARFRVPFVELKSQVGSADPVLDTAQLSMALSVDGGINFENPIVLDMPQEPSSVQRTIFKQLGSFEFSMVMQFDVLTSKKK